MEMEISGSRQKPSTIQKTLSVRPRRTLALLPHCRLGRAGGSPFLICASCCGPPRRSIWHRGGWGCWCSNRCRGCRGSGGRSGCASCPSCPPCRAPSPPPGGGAGAAALGRGLRVRGGVGWSVFLEAVAGVFGGAGGVAAEEVFQRAAEGSGEQQHLRIHHAALAVLDLEDGFSHNVPPQKLAGPGEILLRPLPGAAQFFDGGAHDVDFLCCGHVTVSVQF